jgi:hypothetical protein
MVIYLEEQASRKLDFPCPVHHHNLTHSVHRLSLETPLHPGEAGRELPMSTRLSRVTTNRTLTEAAKSKASAHSCHESRIICRVQSRYSGHPFRKSRSGGGSVGTSRSPRSQRASCHSAARCDNARTSLTSCHLYAVNVMKEPSTKVCRTFEVKQAL